MLRSRARTTPQAAPGRVGKLSVPCVGHTQNCPLEAPTWDLHGAPLEERALPLFPPPRQSSGQDGFNPAEFHRVPNPRGSPGLDHVGRGVAGGPWPCRRFLRVSSLLSRGGHRCHGPAHVLTGMGPRSLCESRAASRRGMHSAAFGSLWSVWQGGRRERRADGARPPSQSRISAHPQSVRGEADDEGTHGSPRGLRCCFRLNFSENEGGGISL